MEQESKEAETPGVSQSPPASSQRRRPGRGRRGRRGRPNYQPKDPPQTSQQASSTTVVDEGSQEVEAGLSSEQGSHSRPQDQRRPAAAGAIEQAIEQVGQIIDSLRETLDEMEEVLETLELAERQKDADEREIELLRRGLRQLQRPRLPQVH